MIDPAASATARRAFACVHARRRVMVANGLRLHALEWGMPGRPGLCFLHCGSGHAHWFDGVAAAFADRFHVIALDQRGHGESEWAPPAAYGTEDFAADVAAVGDALGWERWVLVGHSMGGHNALAFAAGCPERVRGLVVVDARPALPAERIAEMQRHGGRPLRRHPTRDAAVAAFRLRPPETTADPALLAHVAEAGVVENGGAWVYRFDPNANLGRRPVDAWLLLDRITAPTCIVRGEGSAVLARTSAERMAAGIGGASLVEIPHAHHHLVLDRPEAFVRALTAFLDGLGGGP